MIIGFPHRPGHGGPGSFQVRFENALKEKGHTIIYADQEIFPDVVFVVGGTRRLFWLLKMRLRGIPVVHRLDGLAWLHKTQGWKANLFGELGNFTFKLIHGFLATHVVYQSRFVQDWWHNSGWNLRLTNSIIYNGIDLDQFYPQLETSLPLSVLCVEGHLDYSPYSVDLLNYLQKELIEKSDNFALIVYGGFSDKKNMARLNRNIDYRGTVTRSELPGIYRNSIYLSLDVNPACPNTVLEALASGVPVVGYNTGSLNELVSDEEGRIVDYGSDPWKLAKPDFKAIRDGIFATRENFDKLSKNARINAVKRFGIESMVSQYMDILKSELKKSAQ